ncbi:MAG: OB-fold domain-containing protein, partial [Opitutae bacterium]
CSVNHRAPHPGFQGRTPFVLAIVELSEGPRMMTNIVGIDPESVKIGMPVTVCFEDINEEVTLPMFKPAN